MDLGISLVLESDVGANFSGLSIELREWRARRFRYLCEKQPKNRGGSDLLTPSENGPDACSCSRPDQETLSSHAADAISVLVGKN
jgi:hypothetical protein